MPRQCRALRYVVILITLGLGVACKSTDGGGPVNTSAPANPTQAATPASSSSKASVDVCGLLTKEDIKAVQGEEPTQMQRSERSEGGQIIAQCYYALPTVSNSVVMNVTSRSGGGGADPRELWKQNFAANESKGGEREKASERDRNSKAKRVGGEEEEDAKPEKVADLGQDAYWVASRVGGALYVLTKDSFFRISVGGAGDAKAKLNKSKTLARKVLPRL